MKKISKDALREALRLHEIWLVEESIGSTQGVVFRNSHLVGERARGGGVKADFSDTDLQGMDFSGSEIVEVDFRKANLQDADLRLADAREARFYGANLKNAKMSCANFQGSNFYMADLRGASLGGSNLQDADFQSADLRGVSFGATHKSPFACRGYNMKVDDRIFYQQLHHLISQDHSSCSEAVRGFLESIPKAWPEFQKEKKYEKINLNTDLEFNFSSECGFKFNGSADNRGIPGV